MMAFIKLFISIYQVVMAALAGMGQLAGHLG